MRNAVELDRLTDLVCRVTVPHNQFAILRGGHQVSTVTCPVHGIDFGQVTLQAIISKVVLLCCCGKVSLHLLIVSGFSSESSRWVPAGWRPGRVWCHSSVSCPPANMIIIKYFYILGI